MKAKVKNFFGKKENKRKTKGQSLVEVALTLPILLMLLAGLVEFGFILNYYLALTEATREVARLFSNYDHEYVNPDTNDTFYEEAVGRAIYVLEPQDVDDTTRKIRIYSNRFIDCTNDPVGVCDNDIVISVYQIASSGNVSLLNRHYWIDSDIRQPSRFDTAKISSRLPSLPSTIANSGALVVEIFYNYEQVLGLPWLEMIQDPVLLHAYTIMPISSAAPTITPTP